MATVHNDFEFLLPIFAAFEAKGKQLFLVGGCVRDLVLHGGHSQIKDFDLCTDALPEETTAILRGVGARTIDKNGGNFGTVHAVWCEEDVEVTTFRKDLDYPMGDRRPVVAFADTLEEDLVRRDFTINAMASRWDGEKFVLVDPLGGCKDLLENRVLRSPQEAVKLMGDDPLRVLRAYRFAHRLGLRIDDDLRSAMRQFATSLADKSSEPTETFALGPEAVLVTAKAHISRERVHDELLKIAGGRAPWVAFKEMMEDGVLQQIIPELANQVGFDQQNPHHHLLLWEHTLSVVEHTVLQGGNGRAVITALLHDVAKPIQFQHVFNCGVCGVVNRKNHGPLPVEERSCEHSVEDLVFVKKQFLAHDTLGGTMAREILARLKFSSKDVEAVGLMIDLHQMDLRESVKAKVVRRFANQVGNLAGEFISFLKGDRLGHAPGAFSTIDYLQTLEQGLLTINVQEMVNPKLPVDGFAVMRELGLKQGRELGDLMKALKEAVLDGEVVTEEQAMEFVRKLHSGDLAIT